MDSLVLLKQTFDTEETIRIEDGTVVEDGAEFIINPYDEYSVEEAVQLKEDHGGTVTVLSIGPPRTEETLRTALAMGADQAILIDPEDTELDEYVIGEILKAVAAEESYDIIFAGYMAIDDGAGQGGLRVAELLDLPHVSTAVNIEVNEDVLTVERDVEGGTEIYEVKTPVVLTTQQGLNEPRYPSIPNQMRAKMMPLEHLTLDDLEIDLDNIQAQTTTIEIMNPPEKGAVEMIEGNSDEQVDKITSILEDVLK